MLTSEEMSSGPLSARGTDSFFLLNLGAMGLVSET
jgi:hypothetical protein